MIHAHALRNKCGTPNNNRKQQAQAALELFFHNITHETLPYLDGKSKDCFFKVPMI